MRKKNNKAVVITLTPELYKKLDIICKASLMTKTKAIASMIECYFNSYIDFTKY